MILYCNLIIAVLDFFSIYDYVIDMEILAFIDNSQADCFKYGEAAMIRVAGYARDVGSVVYLEDIQKPLFVSGSGYQRFPSKNYSIQRPSGRPDYQLLYIYKGCGHFFLNGCWQDIPAGNIVLYSPSEPQIYSYYAKETPQIYWVHFTGTGVPALLKTYDIRNGYVGENRLLKQLFDEIILELQLKKPLFQDITLLLFQQLLPQIHRIRLSQSAADDQTALIDQLIIRLNQQYMEPWDIASMADFCNLSPYYFSHQFKAVAGVAPVQYLNRLRIEKAKELLLTEDLSVSEVSMLVGYKDPLYFSKAFKKATGSSPKSFHGNRLNFDETFEGTLH